VTQNLLGQLFGCGTITVTGLAGRASCSPTSGAAQFRRAVRLRRQPRVWLTRGEEQLFAQLLAVAAAGRTAVRQPRRIDQSDHTAA